LSSLRIIGSVVSALQIMRRKLPYPGELSPPADNLPGLCGRERLIELERPVIDQGLKDELLGTITVEIAPAVAVQFEILINGLLTSSGKGMVRSLRPLILTRKTHRPWFHRLSDSFRLQASAT
jgi:hypothetical protein